MDRIYDTVIIGAGPAGMTAAACAAQEGKKVLLLERQDKIGKKILVTGNGRCNITNLDQKPEYYRSDAPQKAWSIFSEYDEKDILKLMDKLGVLTKDRDGYVYPYNDQASSVREAFEDYLSSLTGLKIMTESTVTRIIKDEKKALFSVYADTGKENSLYQTPTVIIASGGYAGIKAGWGGDGYRFAGQMGHHIIATAPALTSLCSPAPFLKKLAGVRSRASISLLTDGQLIYRESGELQWTDYGISGVAVFSLSRYAIRALEEGKKTWVEIDLLPDLTAGRLTSLLIKYRETCGYKSSGSLLNGLIARKLSPVILREAGITKAKKKQQDNPADVKIKELSDKDIEKLAAVLKAFPLKINAYKSYEKAQVTMGGVPLKELTRHLESKLCPGLFFAGEVIDVDGKCGGYNLSWAISSGKTAGTQAVRPENTERKKDR